MTRTSRKPPSEELARKEKLKTKWAALGARPSARSNASLYANRFFAGGVALLRIGRNDSAVTGRIVKSGEKNEKWAVCDHFPAAGGSKPVLIRLETAGRIVPQLDGQGGASE